MLAFVMNCFFWLTLAVIIAAVAAVTGVNRKERDTSLTPT